MPVYLWRLELLVPSSNVSSADSLGVGNVDAGKSTLLGKSICFPYLTCRCFDERRLG
jgi:hypothetical protein